MKLIVVLSILYSAYAVTCYDGEFKVGDPKVAEYCYKCSEHCEGKCQDNVGCAKCKPGFYKFGFGCEPCTSGCNECEDGEHCKEGGCADNYYYLEKNCYVKPEHCEVAETNKGCTKCELGYFLLNVTNGNCTTCGMGCDLSNANNCDPTKTIGCKKVNTTNPEKQYFIAGGVAMPCDDKCNICYEETNGKGEGDYKPIEDGFKIPIGEEGGCYECDEGFYVEPGKEQSQTEQCKECNVVCKTCKLTAMNCLECKSINGTQYFEYEIVGENGTITTCRPKQPESICGSSKDDKDAKCTTCKDGYYNDDGLCEVSHPQCSVNKTDDKSNICIKCNEGYIAYNKTCVLKPTNCLLYNKDTGLCDECGHMTYNVGGFCTPCDENCIQCDNKNGTCFDCAPGYYSNNTKDCKAESVQDSGVTPLYQAGNNTHPQKCNEGEYVNFARNPRECKSCSAYCLEETIELVEADGNVTYPKISYCDPSVGCTRCKPGFYVSQDGECSSCPVHCAYCDQSLGCLHCLGDAVMSQGRCEYSGASTVLTLLIVLILAFAI